MARFRVMCTKLLRSLFACSVWVSMACGGAGIPEPAVTDCVQPAPPDVVKTENSKHEILSADKYFKLAVNSASHGFIWPATIESIDGSPTLVLTHKQNRYPFVTFLGIPADASCVKDAFEVTLFPNPDELEMICYDDEDAPAYWWYVDDRTPIAIRMDSLDIKGFGWSDEKRCIVEWTLLPPILTSKENSILEMSMTHYEDDCPDDGDGHVWEDEGDAPVAEDAVEAAEEALESVSRRFDFLPLNGEEILTLNADTEQFEIKSASGERLYKLPLEGIDNFYYEATVRLYRQKGAEMVIQIHEEGNGRCNHEGGSMTREVVLKIQTEQGDATFDAIYTSALYTAEKYTTVSSTSESGEDMTRRIELPHGALEVETALESKMIHEDYAGHCADGTKSGRESGCTCAGRDYSHFEENTVWTFFFNASAGGPDGKTKWELETEKQRTPKDVWCKCCEQSDEVE